MESRPDLSADDEYLFYAGGVALEGGGVDGDVVVEGRQEVEEVVVALLGEHGEEVVEQLPHGRRDGRHRQRVHQRQDLLVKL